MNFCPFLPERGKSSCFILLILSKISLLVLSTLSSLALDY